MSVPRFLELATPENISRVHPITHAILCLAALQGATHDLTLFHASKTKLHPETALIADAGYQGILRAHSCARTPTKATKKHPLTPAQKQDNQTLSRLRLPTLHVIRCLKIFRCLSSVYRHRRRRLQLRLSLLAGLYNAMLLCP
ncbi:transposase family protein [Deinococcus sp. KNUC1210]|uniref:transposase family protein n=1 Tax=Deinococcus sp. KNUC1210 TaxID=2917691 RepID=UPI00351D31F3